MAEIIANLELNSTVFIQFFIFIVIFIALKYVFFAPFQRLIELREKSTIGDLHEAQKLMDEARERMEKYQGLLHDAKVQARAKFDEELLIAKMQETKIIIDAREEAKSITQKAISEMETEKTRLSGELKAEVKVLAGQVAERVLES